MAAKSRHTADDPIRALEEDHREVEALFERLEGARGADARAKAFAAIKDALALHATLEEAIFYPAVMSLPDMEAMHAISEAVEDHGLVKGLLAEIEGTDPEAPWFLEKCSALRLAVSEHVEEEESGMFPRARKLLDAKRLAALGERLTAVREARKGADRELRAAARSQG